MVWVCRSENRLCASVGRKDPSGLSLGMGNCLEPSQAEVSSLRDRMKQANQRVGEWRKSQGGVHARESASHQHRVLITVVLFRSPVYIIQMRS